MKLITRSVAALAVTALSVGSATAIADSDDRNSRQAVDTRADYTPFEEFEPLPTSSACQGEGSGRQAQPFVTPPGYLQQVVSEESDQLADSPPGPPGMEDLFDMLTQNEFGKQAGRFLYRTHEVGPAASGAAPRDPGGAAVTATDLRTGVTRTLAERNDWERFDGIVWTPWGTILAAEEVITAAAQDPQVPQAVGGLVYELFVDEDEPWKLDPMREPVTPGDGTTDTDQDGIRARPALGAKSHEGLRFDKRGYFYGIAESRGQTVADQSGGVFRFVPDRKGDLSSGELSALRTDDRRYGEGEWVALDRDEVQVNADAAAKAADVNLYQRPEDVETGESTGNDRLNGGWTLYVAITEGAENGVMAVDLRSRSDPFAYAYVGPNAGNAVNPEFTSSDNLALDSKGNLAITEDGGSQGGGDDVWVAAPPRSGGHQPASTVQRLLSIKDCEAEPTGIYFALKGTERWSSGPMTAVKAYDEDTVNGETLFLDRQHAADTSPVDQTVAIAPQDEDDDDDDGGDDD
jgi:uncharacterized protein